MKNFWAITIGINQYQHFQPLGYAQRDATMMHHFFVEDLGIPAEHCVLLTEVSPSIYPQAIYPDSGNIRSAITQLCQQRIQPGDLVWILFSGYGVRFNGQDYLVPIDGQPDKIPTTAIAVEQLMTALRNAPTKNIVLALDINRSQGIIDGQHVGTQITELAQRYGISTLLSCQPHQFSHETLALRHGFFTAALLEGLRYERCLTLDSLISYLNRRLPELTEHHWRPQQDPLAVVSIDQKYELILPKDVAVARDSSPSPALPTFPDLDLQAERLTHDRLHQRQQVGATTGPPPATVSSTIPSKIATGSSSLGSLTAAASSPTHPYPPASAVSNSPSSQTPPTAHPSNEDAFWRKAVAWGSLFVVALLAGVVLVNRDALLNAASAGNSPGEAAPSATMEPSATPSDVEVMNRAMLDEAIASLLETRAASPVNQATDFRRAINLAQRIPAGEPFYDEAQGYIARWSQIIHDFALARATQGNYRAAIATSQLIPIDQTDLQEQVSARMAEWQQGAVNQDVLDRAKALTRSQQASSYNEAIALAKNIPEGQPLYTQAQTLIDQWSRDIFTLARGRAAQRNFQSAIETAGLIPEGTPSYEEAQAAIAQWQQQAQQ